MNKTYKNILILVTLIFILILYLINSSLIISSLIDYSKLFLTKLFPVSFIFFVFSSLLLDYGIIENIEKYFHVNASNIYIFLISLISGFPSGAKYTKELYKKEIIDLETANNYIMFSHFPNPLFIIGSVNMVLNDINLSIKILISIIISNFIIMLFSKKSISKHCSEYSIPNSFSSSLVVAINNSFKTIILIYGTSLFFYLISCIIVKYISLNTYGYVLLSGVFDLTKGVFSTTLINDTTLRALFILFFISFGGLSIHMQVNSMIIDSPISYKKFVIGRIIATIISFILFFVIPL